MNQLIEHLATDPWGRLALQHIQTGGLWNCYVFLLVAARLAGLFIVAPFFKPTAIPFTVRASLVVLFSFIIAPTLSEIGHQVGESTRVNYDLSSTEIPTTISDIACVVISEMGIGTMLGIGLIVLFSGLQQGGAWLDRQSGLGLGSVVHPEFSGGESACGSLAQLLGIAAVLLMEPVGGHLVLIQSLVNTFQAIPVGSASWTISVFDLMSGVVQQSLVLGLRVAMPMMATMMLVDVALSLVNRNASASMNTPLLAIRTGIAVIVLALTMTAIPDVIATVLFS